MDFKSVAMKQAAQFMAEHRYHDAEEIYEQFIDEQDSKMGLATILFESGKYTEAKSLLDGINTAESNLALATIAKNEDDVLAEEFHIREAYSMSNGDLWKPLVDFLVSKERWNECVPVLSKVNTELSGIMLADVYVHLSELGLARNLLKAIIKENKNNIGAHLELCNIAHNKDDFLPNTDTELKRLLNMRATLKANESSIWNSIGKFMEKHERYDEAGTAYDNFLNLEKAKINPKVFDSRLSIDKVAEKYTKELIESIPKPKNECPLIFVLGMPRSGTTLIESTLIGHPEISTYGETVGISMMIDDLVSGKISPANPDEALQYYLQGKKKFEGKFVIDKMPGNFHYIGAIYQMFPDAKFIYSKRDSFDNSVACMVTQFKQGHPYSYDALEMAIEYKSHEKFIELWKNILPEGTILEVEYENMVNNHQNETEKMLEFIGVDFDDKCLEFYKQKRDVKTASLAQVVNPIYDSSIGRGAKLLSSEEFKKLRELLKLDYNELLNIKERNR